MYNSSIDYLLKCITKKVMTVIMVNDSLKFLNINFIIFIMHANNIMSDSDIHVS